MFRRLSRDARMCGVPYGTVDVDRLLASLTLVQVGPDRLEVGVQEKGVSALESLLFANRHIADSRCRVDAEADPCTKFIDASGGSAFIER